MASSSSSSNAPLETGGWREPCTVPDTSDSGGWRKPRTEHARNQDTEQKGRGRSANRSCYQRLLGWKKCIFAFIHDILFVSAAPPEDHAAVGKFDQSDYPTLFAYTVKLLEQQERQGTLIFKHLNVCRKVLDGSVNLLEDFCVDDSCRNGAALSDSTLIGKVGNKDDPWDGSMFAKCFVTSPLLTELKCGTLVVKCHCAGQLKDILVLLKKLIEIEAGGNPCALKRNVVIVFSLNELNKKLGNQYIGDDSQLLVNARAFADYVRQIPLGVLSFMGPGDELIWGYGKGTWNHLAKPFTDALQKSGHPIWSPVAVYSQMEMNKLISQTNKAEVKASKDAARLDSSLPILEPEYGYSPDFHFTSNEFTYKQLTNLVAACMKLTQLLGSLCSVAGQVSKLGEGVVEGNLNVAQGSEFAALYTLDLPETGSGAIPAQTPEDSVWPPVASSSLAVGESPAQAADDDVPAPTSPAEEVEMEPVHITLEESVATDALLSRLPLVGEYMTTMPRTTTPSGKLYPPCREYAFDTGMEPQCVGIRGYNELIGPIEAIKVISVKDRFDQEKPDNLCVLVPLCALFLT
jgi:hypothetical protein